MKLKVISFVSPQPGNLYTEVLFKQPRKTICFSPINGHKAAALEIAIIPYGFGSFKLTWSEYVTDIETAKLAKKEDGKTPKYDSFREFLNSNIIIGYRTEYVPFFKEVESHPFVVESLSAVDGVSTEIVITIVTKINFPEDGGPLKILALEDPFGFIFGFVNEAIILWANARSSKAVRAMTTDDVANPLIEDITIEGEFYLDYLNKKIFKKYEIEVTNVNLKTVAVAKKDANILEAEKEVVAEASAALKAVETKKKRLKLNEAQQEENKTALTFYEGKTKAKTKMITESAKAVADMNAGFGRNNKDLKVLSVGDTTKLLTELITATEAANEV